MKLDHRRVDHQDRQPLLAAAVLRTYLEQSRQPQALWLPIRCHGFSLNEPPNCEFRAASQPQANIVSMTTAALDQLDPIWPDWLDR